MLQLVLDCRMINLLCRAPPKNQLATVNALSDLQLPPAGDDGDGVVCSPRVAAVDFIDSSYILENTRIAELFASTFSFRASDFDFYGVYDDAGVWTSLEPHDEVFACIGTRFSSAHGPGWSVVRDGS